MKNAAGWSSLHYHQYGLTMLLMGSHTTDAYSWHWTHNVLVAICLDSSWASLQVPGPNRLTFMWWGCCSLFLWHKPTKLAHSFSFCSCVRFWLYGPLNCISFHKFSRQLSAFSLCFSGLISAILVLSTIISLSIYASLPLLWDNPLWFRWRGLKHQLSY